MKYDLKPNMTASEKEAYLAWRRYQWYKCAGGKELWDSMSHHIDNAGKVLHCKSNPIFDYK